MAKDKVDITVVDRQQLTEITNAFPPLLARSDLETIGSPDTSKLQILISATAFAVIDEHTHSDLKHEVGGFLIGKPYHWQGQNYVEIVAASVGQATSFSAVHLTISPDMWLQAQEEVRTNWPGMYLVGWYHTHPYMSVFMSAQDIGIHQGFFREPWHVALVVDPSVSKANFFTWDDGEIVPSSGYYVDTSVSGDRLWHYSKPTRYHQLLEKITMDEFYEPGFWYSRQQPDDTRLVKVKADLLAKLSQIKRSSKDGIFGVCFGKLLYNAEAEGPLFFIEVTDLHQYEKPLLLSDRKLTAEIESRLQKMVAALEESERVGLFLFHVEANRPEQLYFASPTLLESTHFVFDDESVNGVAKSLWQKQHGYMAKRPLIEAIALPDLSREGMEEILSDIQAALPERQE